MKTPKPPLEAEYRGYKIKAWRENCMGGWPMTYYTVTRIKDGFNAVCNFSEGEPPRSMIKNMKCRIDNELLEDDPWMERAEFGEDEAA